MKKLNKLFAILIAVLGVQTLSAQQTPTAGNTYYMYNAETGLFLSRGANYGAAAWADNFGIPVTLIQNESGFQLQYFDSPSHYVSDAWWSWADGGTDRAQTYTLNKVSEGNYKLINTHHGTQNLTLYINEGADGGGFSRQIASNGKYGDNCNENWDVWQFLTSAEREAILAKKKKTSEMSCANSLGYTLSDGQSLHTLVGDATNFATTDKTSAIKNATLTTNYDNWQWVGTSGNPAPQVGSGIEVYQGSGRFTQTISGLAPGLYKVTLSAFFRDGSNANCSAKGNEGWRLSNAYLEANGNQTMIADWASERSADNEPNSPAAAKVLFDEGKYKNEVFSIVGEDGILTITIAQPGAAVEGRWFFFANTTLTYYTDRVDANATTEILKKYDDVINLIPTAVKNNLTSTKNSFESNPTIDHYNTLSTAIGNANTFVAPYASLNALIELCDEYAAESYSNVATSDVRTTFTTAITSAVNNGNAATTVATLEKVHSILEAARQAYVKAAIPTTGNRFDMTFLMTNPQVTSANGWTNGGTAVNQQYTGAPDNTYLDFYQVTRDMHQTLSGLPSGSYSVKAATRGHTDVTVGYIYVKNGENKITADIHKVGNAGNTLEGGWDWTTTGAVAVTDGLLTIGFYAECGTDQWVGADVFSLYRAYDASLAAPMQASVTSLKSEAESLVDEIMSANAKEALTTAINGADASSTNPFALDAMIVALSSAIAEAQTSIADYEKIATYIAKAKAIGVALADDYQTQYDNRTLAGDAVTIFQNLEVATYNYVKSNFTYSVPLSNTWSSTGTNTSAKEFYNEHWSGETRGYMNQNDDNGQGWNANAWSLDFDQDVTLPAGEYVFKVAGRKSAGTTLELVVTMGETELGTVNDFPASNNARGINKAGVTSFDPEDEAGFARDGNGFGWQWRYVKFTLNAESTVKVAVHAEANEIHQWVSFGDYTLQMTEETYLEANKGGLDAPTAEAQALVNAVPMGTEEIAALNTALNLPVTTGQQLLDKIEALKTAVANAESWVVKYNNAKAPLVAALDRFEVDYNNAENGASSKMSNSAWANILDKVQAAALAKDVTDSYDGFAVAAEELNAALDAAQASINAYAALDEAIKNAEALASANVGDQPFQRPVSAQANLNEAIATAQTAYDKAEADATEMKNTLATAVEAFNNAELNAPAEGLRFYIKVATEGHGKNGSAWLVTLGATGDNNPTGYGINANNAVKAHMPQAFIFTQVEGNLYNISIERAEGTVYLTYGALNGSAAGWKNQQIQATTNAEKKGEFKIVPTGKNGILKIFNIIDNNYLDCQDGGAIYTDTGIENEEFAFELATETEVTLTIPEEGWTTLILPFDAELPENVKAYSCSEVENNVLTLVEAESLKANTPYLVNGYENDYDFSGYGLADKDSYTDGLFTGTYVEYQTTANSNTYVLQNVNSELGFYLVGENEQPAVDAYCCYITYEAQEGEEQTTMFLLSGGQEDDPTAIEDTEHKAQGAVLVYDLMGRKVTTMEKGKFYIVNGVKVIIK